MTEPSKRPGQVMIALAWIIALALLTRYFAGVEEQQYNPNQLPLTATNSNEVILKQNRRGHYVLTAAINGHDATLLLDTGATDVVIADELARKIGLTRGISGYANTANGRVKIYQTTINTLQIGSIVLYSVPASINPAMNGDEVLLGMSALKQLEFSQRGKELTLRLLDPQQVSQ